jgi:hypothetical protein
MRETRKVAPIPRSAAADGLTDEIRRWLGCRRCAATDRFCGHDSSRRGRRILIAFSERVDAQNGMVEFNVGVPSDRRIEFRTVLLRARLG